MEYRGLAYAIASLLVILGFISLVINLFRKKDRKSSIKDERSEQSKIQKCPLCAETIRLEANKCRFCGHRFDPEEVEKHVQALKAEEAGLKKCPSCGNLDAYWAYVEDGGMGWWCPHCKKSVSRDFRQIQPSSSKVEIGEKKCPLCAETIRLEAKKCRFCGHLFDPEEVEENVQALKAKEAGLKKCPSCGKWDAYHAYVEDGGMGWWCPHCKKSVNELHTPEDVELKQVEDSSITVLAFVGAFIGLFIGLVLGGIIAGLGGPTIISVMVFLGAPIAGIIIMIRLNRKD